MARRTSPTLPALMLASALLPVSVATRAQPPRDAEQPGVSGYVLAPDGTPVSGGRVVIQAPGIAGSMSPIERTGRFRLVPNMPGAYRLSVAVPGFAAYQLSVAVPMSRILKLPVIRLSPATYFRARFVSAAGELITAPSLRRSFFGGNAMPVGDSADAVDSDGTITIGPLPLGVTMLALDTPPLAQTRLPDLNVTGAETLLDGGTVIVQPGAVLNVDVVDETGKPVPNHVVLLEDGRSPSPLAFVPAPLTNQQGRVSFDRLSEGRYRLRAGATGVCDYSRLSVSRLVSVSGNGALLTRLVVGGHATFRLTSGGVPLKGSLISGWPEAAPSSPPPVGVRGSSNVPLLAGRLLAPFEIGCAGTTDDNGRVTLKTFPPGPARLDVPLQHSTYKQRVTVPEGGGELAIVIPDGFLAVRVTGAVGIQPVAGAALTWQGGGARVEATAAANGEALLEGVGLTGGTLTVTAPGYQPAQVRLAEPPGVLQEVTLLPAPVTSVELHVVSPSGDPVAGAVVEIASQNPIEVGQLAVTDANGFVRFPDAPAGALRLVASADGFVTVGMQVSESNRDGIVLKLSRGHRVIAGVQLPPEAGPYLVRVTNEVGASMERFLDSASDRRIEPPGRISLGPLAPGVYAIELRNARDHRQERVRIVERDVYAVFR